MATDGITITEDRAKIVDFSDGYIQIEERMMELETTLPELEEQMVQAATNYSKLSQLQQEHDKLAAELEEIMERWLELSEIAEGG